MRRRLRSVPVLVGLAVVVGAGVVALWPRADRITRANFDRIAEGMSRAEVEAVLGPAGDYSTGPLILAERYSYAFSGPGPHPVGDFVQIAYRVLGQRRLEEVNWRSDRQLVEVNFGPTGIVNSAGCYDVTRLEQSTFENVLWRAHRQWRRWFPEK